MSFHSLSHFFACLSVKGLRNVCLQLPWGAGYLPSLGISITASFAGRAKNVSTRVMALTLGLSRYMALGKMFHLSGRLKMKGPGKVILKVPPLWHTLAGYFQKLGKSSEELLEENWLEHSTLGEVSNFQWNRRILPTRGVLRKNSMVHFTGLGRNLSHSWD